MAEFKLRQTGEEVQKILDNGEFFVVGRHSLKLGINFGTELSVSDPSDAALLITGNENNIAFSNKMALSLGTFFVGQYLGLHSTSGDFVMGAGYGGSLDTGIVVNGSLKFFCTSTEINIINLRNGKTAIIPLA